MVKQVFDVERQAELNLKFSQFEIPPVQDALLIGRNAPIGVEAVKRMLEAIAPNQYETIKLDTNPIEGIIIKKNILKMLPPNKLIDVILEEGTKIFSPSSVMKIQINVSVVINRSVNL